MRTEVGDRDRGHNRRTGIGIVFQDQMSGSVCMEQGIVLLVLFMATTGCMLEHQSTRVVKKHTLLRKIVKY